MVSSICLRSGQLLNEENHRSVYVRLRIARSFARRIESLFLGRDFCWGQLLYILLLAPSGSENISRWLSASASKCKQLVYSGQCVGSLVNISFFARTVYYCAFPYYFTAPVIDRNPSDQGEATPGPDWYLGM